MPLSTSPCCAPALSSARLRGTDNLEMELRTPPGVAKTDARRNCEPLSTRRTRRHGEHGEKRRRFEGERRALGYRVVLQGHGAPCPCGFRRASANPSPGETANLFQHGEHGDTESTEKSERDSRGAPGVGLLGGFVGARRAVPLRIPPGVGFAGRFSLVEQQSAGSFLRRDAPQLPTLPPRGGGAGERG
jgi:hypothetical protein